MSIPFPHVGYAEKSRKRIRVFQSGQVLADTRKAKLVWEHVFYPSYYIPINDVDEIYFEHAGGTTEADQYDIVVGDRRASHAAQLFKSGEHNGWLKIGFDKVDAWFEEDEEIFVHPKDPYKRVDVLQSSRHVRVELNGVEVANTTKARLLYETGLPTRTYIPKTDCRLEYFESSDLMSACPYKGVANYYDLKVPGHEKAEGIVWWYRNPNLECADIKGFVAFYDEKVDVFVDGDKVPRPKTHFG